MKNSEQPAFAYNEQYEYHLNGNGVSSIHRAGGLTKLEYFAALAMQGSLANGYHTVGNDVAKESVNYAKALLAELEKESTNQ